jgi:glycosyltransferase involved in cell wall biosynthesis
MRIAFVRLPATPLVDPTCSGLFGGAEVRAVTFARALAAIGSHQVQLVVQSIGGRPLAHVGPLQIVTVAGRRRSVDRRFGWSLCWQLPADTVRRVSGSIRRRFEAQPRPSHTFCQLDADVLATFGVHDPSATVVASARHVGKRVVVFLTSDEDARRALDPAEPLGRNTRRHRWALLAADAVVVQTDYQRQLVERAGQRALLVRNPIDLRLGAGDLVPMERRRHVLWVGRADCDSKRADLCWQLARACPGVPFVAVLNPTDAATTASLRRSQPANVRRIDGVGWEASETLYQHALALLNTSESEGFPNAFLQAAKYGVPILSRRANPDGVLTVHGIGQVADDSLPQLAEWIRAVHRGPAQFQPMADAARRYVVQFHELGQRARELQRALESVAAAAPRPQRTPGSLRTPRSPRTRVGWLAAERSEAPGNRGLGAHFVRPQAPQD